MTADTSLTVDPEVEALSEALARSNGRAFESQPWDLGDNAHTVGNDNEADAIDRAAKRRCDKPHQGIADLTAMGHGFSVQTFGGVSRVPRDTGAEFHTFPQCRYCSAALVAPPANPYVCEFDTDYDEHSTGCEYGSHIGPVRAPRLIARPIDRLEPRYFNGDRRRVPGHYDIGGIPVWKSARTNRVPIDLDWDESLCDLPPDYLPDELVRWPDVGPPVTEGPCRCTPCTIRLEMARGAGAVPQVCSFPDCRARQAEEQRERERVALAAKREEQNERDREKATLELELDPHRTDKEIAAQLGIRRVRVKEARKNMSGLIH